MASDMLTTAPPKSARDEQAGAGAAVHEWLGGATNEVVLAGGQAVNVASVMCAVTDLQIGRKLGTGAFGEVRAAVVRGQPGNLLAVKRTFAPSDPEVVCDPKAEIQMLEMLRLSHSSFVTQLCGWAELEGGVVLMVFPRAAMTLGDHLRHCGGTLSEGHARFYSGCMVLALEAAAGVGMLHRDLKPDK
jgi:serine/threonine protein kinase